MLPFEDMVTGEPTFEEMTNLVCTRKLRPIIPERFYDNQVLKVIAKLIQVMYKVVQSKPHLSDQLICPFLKRFFCHFKVRPLTSFLSSSAVRNVP